MRRLALLPLAAALAATPHTGRAQYLATVSRYTAAGCGSGTVAYDPATRSLLSGVVACLSGPVTLDLFAPTYPGQGASLVYRGQLAITYNSFFQSRPINFYYGYLSSTYVRADGLPCPGGSAGPYCTDNYASVQQTSVLPGTLAFTSYFSQPASTALLSSVAPTSAYLNFYYRDPNPSGFGASAYLYVPLTFTVASPFGFTATPEPGTFVLAAGGLAGLGLGARRRRVS